MYKCNAQQSYSCEYYLFCPFRFRRGRHIEIGLYYYSGGVNGVNQ